MVCIYRKKVFGFGLYLRVVDLDLDCIYMRNYFKYLDLDFIYELCQYLNLDLDLQVMDLCPPLVCTKFLIRPNDTVPNQ